MEANSIAELMQNAIRDDLVQTPEEFAEYYGADSIFEIDKPINFKITMPDPIFTIL